MKKFLPDWARRPYVPVPSYCSKDGCAKEFQRTSQRPTLCPDCRKEKDKESRTERRQRKERVETLARAMGHREPHEVAKKAEQAYADGHGIVPDRQPVGTYTVDGSDDGHTTEFKDLAEVLRQNHGAATMHRWWYENSHWVEFD